MISPVSPAGKGFTMVEVLVAAMFFILGILALYRLQLSVIQTNAYAGRLSQATATAESRMESLLALGYDGLSSATAPQAVGPFSVMWTVIPDQPITDAKTVRVEVSWIDSRKQTHGVVLQSVKGK